MIGRRRHGRFHAFKTEPFKPYRVLYKISGTLSKIYTLRKRIKIAGKQGTIHPSSRLAGLRGIGSTARNVKHLSCIHGSRIKNSNEAYPVGIRNFEAIVRKCFTPSKTEDRLFSGDMEISGNTP